MTRASMSSVDRRGSSSAKGRSVARRLVGAAATTASVLLRLGGGGAAGGGPSVASAAPLLYRVGHGHSECVHERLDEDEHATVSLFVYDGEWSEASLTFEGPVASVSAVRGPDVVEGIERFERGEGAVSHSDRSPPPPSDDDAIDKRGAILFTDHVSFEHGDYGDDYVERSYSRDDVDAGDAGESRRRETRRRERRERERRETRQRILEGSPYEKTFRIVASGWYRACVQPTRSKIMVELDVRKSSDHGAPDPRRHYGHVPPRRDEDPFATDEENMPAPDEEAAENEDVDHLTESLRKLRRFFDESRRKTEDAHRQTASHATHSDHSQRSIFRRSIAETTVFAGVLTIQVYVVQRWFKGGPMLGR